jgi:uncharacterized repeat protein (TIGR01451 family)
MSMLSWGVGRRLAWAVAASLLWLPAPAALRAQEALPAEPVPDADGRVQVLVELEDAPAARVYGEVLHDAKLAPAEAKAQAARLAAAQVRKIAAAQESVAASLPSAASPVEIYRVQKAFNGIALQIDADGVAALRAIPGVRTVRPLELAVPTNSTSVPFLGTPNVWGNTIGLPAGVTGTGIRIGVIDTGVDYQHADFGGTGLLTDYQANDRTVAPDAYFPSAKVVGGFDFAGDAYTGSNLPAPDADPMDCNGHGSHVSGTATGLGVNADGSTYTGTYGPSTPFAAMRLGPGTAPGATLYALRVFGCGGSTGLTIQAIDWAMDPNNDDDLSDHLDVINMSLGSPYGSANGDTAVAAENAALAGVIVVASAGNSGDSYFITGSPGSSGRTISVAASTDDGVGAPVARVNTPAGIAGFYTVGTAAFGLPAPSGGLTANVVIGTDPADAAGPLTTDGCSPLTNAAAVAGKFALIDRGTCGFIVKVKNAQDAGAIGAIIANSAAGAFGNLGGADPTITIPSVMFTFADGNTLKANIATLNVTLFPGTDTLGSFSSRGPRRASSPVRLKPDVAAPGVSITSVQTGVTCTAAAVGCQVANASGFLAGNQTLNLQGTSMASPHIAGIMALLRQIHPDWTVEELKALVMNTATHDIFALPGGTPPRNNPSRIGAGRVDPSNAAVSPVIAANADEAGLVSVSFDTEVVGVVTQVKRVRIVNRGSTSQTYDLGLDTILDAPGVAFSLPGGSTVTVPAGDAVLIDVRMDADAAQMDHFRDPLVAATQLPAGTVGTATGPVARPWLTEESGFLTLSQSAAVKLRVPVYMANRPASTMTAADTIATGGAPTGATTIALSGGGVCTGTLGATCTGTFPNDEVSLVSPFELQAVSPPDPFNIPGGFGDIQYGGVAWNAAQGMLLFGVSTWGDWSSPNEFSINVCIDNNEDGVYDFLIFNSNGGTLGGSTTQQDSHIIAFRNLTTGATSLSLPPIFPNLGSPAAIDSAIFLNNAMILPMAPSLIGFTAGDTNFRYKIVTCGIGAACARSTTGDHCTPAAGTFYDIAPGPYTWNWAAPGLDFGGANLLQDLNGASIPVSWNTANMTANGSLGALLFHHHNKEGNRVEIAVLQGAASADLALTKSVAPASPTLGQNVTFTLTVTNNGPSAATGVQVSDLLPFGVTYVSDDGGGAYLPGTGAWTVGSLAVAGSATLHIVASVDVTDQVCNEAVIGAASPVDPVSTNNHSKVCIMAPRSADLGLTMGVSSPTVLVGGSVTYTLTVTNNGDDPAYAVDVQEAFAAFPALNPTSFTASQGSYNPATGLWNLAILPSGQTATLGITFTAPNTAGPLTDQGTASAGTGDPVNANNTASATTTVLSPANVTATKTVAGTFHIGQNVTYTVTLNNSASFDQQDNAASNELVDVLPASLTLVSASASSGAATATIGTNTVTWNGAVPASGSVTVTIVATINAVAAGSTISNQGTLNYDADGNGVNEATRTTDDPGVGGATDPTSFIVLSPASVSATKTVAGTFRVGQNVTYTVTLSNSSGSAQQDNAGNEFTDVLPSTLTLVSASAGTGSAAADTGTNTVTWNGAVPASGSVTVTIVATINSVAPGTTISNQGATSYDSDGNGLNEASGLTDDPGVGGAADPTSLIVLSPAAVTGTMSVSGSFAPGSNVTYTVVLTNNTASRAAVKALQGDNPGPEFVDVLPAQLTLVSASATSGVASATVATNTVTWDGSIPAGGSVTITIVALIESGTTGQTITNQGTINFDADGNGTNESSGMTDSPALPGAADPTAFVALGGVSEIPTLNEIGFAILCLLLAGAAFLRLRRRTA